MLATQNLTLRILLRTNWQNSGTVSVKIEIKSDIEVEQWIVIT